MAEGNSGCSRVEVNGEQVSMDGEATEKAMKPEESSESSTATVATEGDDEPMTKFFALLKNVREMREQWRRKVVVDNRPTKRPKVDRSPWTPTFQWEDFAGVEGLSKWPTAAPAESGISEVVEQKKEEAKLDLRLAL